MKMKYVNWNPKDSSLRLVDLSNSIIQEYQSSDLILTLRQLYYQLVSRDVIENTEKSYKNLGSIITKARNAGLLSWDSIEDRNREHQDYWVREDPEGLIDILPDNIRFDQWKRQDYYVEVWVEKEALGNIVQKACDPLMVPYMSCKGYLSASEAWRAGRRLKDKINGGRKCIIFHLGDHDPSGFDMSRDNQKRLNLYSDNCGVELRRIALDMHQIEQYDPPPNPTKLSDSRAKDYVKKYGSNSWELDALQPDILINLINDNVKPLIDTEMWNEVSQQEADTKDVLNRLSENWDDVKEYLRTM